MLKKAILNIELLGKLECGIEEDDTAEIIISKIRRGLEKLPDAGWLKENITATVNFVEHELNHILSSYNIGELLDIEFRQNNWDLFIAELV